VPTGLERALRMLDGVAAVLWHSGAAANVVAGCREWLAETPGYGSVAHPLVFGATAAACSTPSGGGACNVASDGSASCGNDAVCAVLPDAMPELPAFLVLGGKLCGAQYFSLEKADAAVQREPPVPVGVLENIADTVTVGEAGEPLLSGAQMQAAGFAFCSTKRADGSDPPPTGTQCGAPS